jgi:hypothetical protein
MRPPWQSHPISTSLAGKAAVAAAAATACVLGLAVPATAAVSAVPATWTPQLNATGTTEQVRQLVQCGGTMYAVGTFTSIKRFSTVYARNNAFSFSATTGVLTSWDPNVNGTVNSIALSADCATAYLGGKFTSVHGTAVNNIASLSTSTGVVNTGFRHSANGQVEALLVSGSHLLTGGYFTGINGSTRRYMVSLNPSTGVDDGYVNLNISGNYVYTDAAGRQSVANATRVYNYALSPSRTKLLVMGDFTSVGGVGRRQIFMLNLGATSTSVDPWYSAEFDANCHVTEPFYLQDAAWSPDGSKVYVATTGYKPATGVGFSTTGPRGGLCDAAAAFSSASVPTQAHLWINYTGCDSLYSAAADANTVYVGGHERWASNDHQCDNNNDGSAVNAPGMVGLSPTTGNVVFNPTRGRGLGADDMVVTSAGLWIASDDYAGTSQCAGQYGHAGICFLPY